MPSECAVVDDKDKELTEKDIKDRLSELRDLVTGDEQLKEYHTDDEYLLRFLHACRFNVRWSYKRMKAFWKVVREYPQWFKKGGPEEYKDILQSKAKIMNGRDKEGRILYTAKLGNLSGEFTLFQEAHLDDLWIESVMDDPIVREKGVAVLVDVSGSSWRLLRWATPTNISAGVRKLEVYPIKDMVLHVVNTTFLMNAGFKVLWPFLNSKMREKVKFHYEDMDSLHEYISPDQLPPEYGGTAEVDYEGVIQNLLNRNAEISERLKFYNEDKTDDEEDDKDEDSDDD